VTKPIYLLHHIVDNPLFAILFYLFCSIACFRPVDRQVESEPSENFHDINFEDLEQQQAGFKGKCLDACCTYFLYLSVGLHASNFMSELWEHLCVISFHVLS
jgi:hypothetical protein